MADERMEVCSERQFSELLMKFVLLFSHFLRQVCGDELVELVLHFPSPTFRESRRLQHLKQIGCLLVGVSRLPSLLSVLYPLNLLQVHLEPAPPGPADGLEVGLFSLRPEIVICRCRLQFLKQPTFWAFSSCGRPGYPSPIYHSVELEPPPLVLPRSTLKEDVMHGFC
uniref:Uncharacterized protein n=1 Tax=Coccidioides posadasii RMSCC 3488 TaxID=454284 RepID=A0A0J6ILZ4_COCPO|nr:hypothetical protein CPAG_09247 [Coccidioides posadasii RMSCC 3488]